MIQRLKGDKRREVEMDLGYWGQVARRRWRCELKVRHVLDKIGELGIQPGPVRYTYEYEPDAYFRQIQNIVERLEGEHIIVLTLHYIDRKPFRDIRKLMELETWNAVRGTLRQAELMYLLTKEMQFLDNGVDCAMIC